ncbi:MAG: hypothetical protein ACOX9E_14675 [Lentisphaeria bacterium]|jgi:hypothetical protein
MKKFVVFLVMALTSVSAFAAFQYSVVKSTVAGKWNDGGPNMGVYGYAYSIKVTEGSGAIYIVDKINNLYSMSGNNELLSLEVDMSSTSNYGWVDVATGVAHNAEGSTIATYSEQKNKWNDLVTQTGYKLGDFSAGDEIGVWLRPKNYDFTGASVFHKDNPINSPQMTYRNAQVGQDATGMDLYQLDYTGIGDDGSIFFGFYGAAGTGGDTGDGTGGDTGGPVGQPLPGTLATLLLGGAIGGAAGMKKRRNKKA